MEGREKRGRLGRRREEPEGETRGGGEGRNEENLMTLEDGSAPPVPTPPLQSFNKGKELGMVREKKQWFFCITQRLLLGRENTGEIEPFSACEALI